MSTCVQPREVNRVSAHSRTQFIYGATGVVEIRTPPWSATSFSTARVVAARRRPVPDAGPRPRRSARALYPGRRAHRGVAERRTRGHGVGTSARVGHPSVRASSLTMTRTDSLDESSTFVSPKCVARSVRKSNMPVLQDRRLIELEGLLRSDPGNDRSLEQWGRTSPCLWENLDPPLSQGNRKQLLDLAPNLRIHLAQPRLASGEPVTVVAMDMGYASPCCIYADCSTHHGNLSERVRAAVLKRGCA